jgi:hypothetical protein
MSRMYYDQVLGGYVHPDCTMGGYCPADEWPDDCACFKNGQLRKGKRIACIYASTLAFCLVAGVVAWIIDPGSVARAGAAISAQLFSG